MARAQTETRAENETHAENGTHAAGARRAAETVGTDRKKIPRMCAETQHL